jgi:hypothetical protein
MRCHVTVWRDDGVLGWYANGLRVHGVHFVVDDLGGGGSRWCVIRVGGCGGVAGHRICGSGANGVDGHVTGDGVDESGRGVVVDRTEAVSLVDLCRPVEPCGFV